MISRLAAARGDSPGSRLPAGSSIEELAGGVAVLALDDDVGSLGFCDSSTARMTTEPLMADDVANVDVAAGLFDFVGDDGEDFAFVGEFGGDEAGFGGGCLLVSGGGNGRRLYLGSHRAKVSSCI